MDISGQAVLSTDNGGDNGGGWDSKPTVGLHRLRFSRPSDDSCNLNYETNLRPDKPCLAQHLPNEICQTSPDLALIVERWLDLPPAVRAGIVAMVKASVAGQSIRPTDERDPG